MPEPSANLPPITFRRERPVWVLPTILALTAVTFILDLLTSLGWAVWVLYLPPLLLTAQWAPRKYLVPTAVVCIALMGAGLLFSTPDIPVTQAVFNRFMGVLVLWTATFLLTQSKQAEEALPKLYDALEQQVEERTAEFRMAIEKLKQEIADRKRAEEALRSSEQRLRLIMEHANDAIFFLDLNGVVQWANPGATVLSGRALNELLGRPITTILTPGSAAIAEARLAAARRGESVPPLVETEILRPDGGSVWLELNATNVADAQGPAGRLVVARDITERKRVEEALQENRQRMELALNGAELGLWDIRIQTGHVVYNRRWAEMLGYTIEDVSPHISSWENLVHPDDWPRVSALWHAHLAGDTALYQTDHRLRAKSGEWKWIQTYGKVLERDQAGKPLRALGIHMDITERKRAEEHLRESEQQLRQLLEDRERIARDLHDNIIQTIYAIGMGLEECQRLIKKDPGLASKAAGGAVENLNAVIRDVRKYIAGLEPQILSGRQLRAELAKLVRTMEVPHLLRFHVSVDPTAAARLTPEEANHVLCVVREAMSNSLRHSHAKSGNISLQLLNGDVRLEVADDGVGFDAHETHKNGEHGEGLRNMEARAQELGARLEVISQRRQGTRVILEIPLERKNV